MHAYMGWWLPIMVKHASKGFISPIPPDKIFIYENGLYCSDRLPITASDRLPITQWLSITASLAYICDIYICKWLLLPPLSSACPHLAPRCCLSPLKMYISEMFVYEMVSIKYNACIIMPTISPFGLDGNTTKIILPLWHQGQRADQGILFPSYTFGCPNMLLLIMNRIMKAISTSYFSGNRSTPQQLATPFSLCQ